MKAYLLSPVNMKQNRKQCVNVTTKGLDLEVKGYEKNNIIGFLACLGALLGIISVIYLYSCISQDMNYGIGHSYLRNYLKKQSFSLNELYPPLITLWDMGKEKSTAMEVKATVIGVPTNMS